MIKNEYDIGKIIMQLEDDLILSMKKNMLKHIKDEKIEGIKWNQWQAEILRGLNEYTIENKSKLKSYYNKINTDIEVLLKTTYTNSALKEEKKILQSIIDGNKKYKLSKNLINRLSKVKGKTIKDKAKHIINNIEVNKDFFKVNERAMNSLVNASLNDFKEVQYSILRKANDVYRQTIYKSQVYAQSGATTIYGAVDLATKDFLSKGISAITLKDGRRMNIQSYSEMYLRTSTKKAYLAGEGEKRKEWGISLVLVSQYGACSKVCLPYQGKVYIDDVYSGGDSKDGDYPLLSSAISNGLYHPNCRHSHSTYFKEINTIPTPLNALKTTENSELEQRQRYNERQIRKYYRLEKGSLDKKNIEHYKNKKNEWISRNNDFISKHSSLRRDKWRETTQVL